MRASATKRAGTFRRRGPRVVRLAGFPVGIGVQREHRRVEHRVVDGLDRCMRRFLPAARTAAEAVVFDAARSYRCSTHIYSSFVVIYTINLYMHIHVYSYMEDRITDACLPHARAPTCAFMRERARLRVGLGAQASAPQRASTFPSTWIACGSAGILTSVCVQREHRRVEHRVRHQVVGGMRRSHTHTCTRTHTHTSII